MASYSRSWCDVNSALVSELNAGVVRIVERDLESLVKQVVSDGLFFAQSNPAPADAYIITVPTPFMVVSDNSAIPEPDLSYVEAAARSIASVLRKGDIVILESTHQWALQRSYQVGLLRAARSNLP